MFMAEEAEQQAEGAEEAPKKKIPMWLIILIASQVVLIGVAVVVLKMLSGAKPAEDQAAAPAVAEQRVDPQSIKDPTQLTGPQYELTPFVVNLIDDGRGPRFLKIQIFFELEVPPGLKPGEEPPVKIELDSRKNQIRDELLMLLTSKRQTDIESSDGKRILRDEIFTRINKLLVTGTIRRVLFTDFVVQ
jgi:flagellar FliL protein